MKSLLAAFIFLTSIPLVAQNHFIGLQGGGSFTNVKADDFWSDSFDRSGFMAGFNYEYQFKNSFQLGLDVLYAQKGFNNSIQIFDTNNVLFNDGRFILTTTTYRYL